MIKQEISSKLASAERLLAQCHAKLAALEANRSAKLAALDAQIGNLRAYIATLEAAAARRRVALNAPTYITPASHPELYTRQRIQRNVVYTLSDVHPARVLPPAVLAPFQDAEGRVEARVLESPEYLAAFRDQ